MSRPDPSPTPGQSIQRLSRVMRGILLALYEEFPDWIHANSVMDTTGIKSGSFYPSARELRRSPWVEFEWRLASDDPNGKPMMHYRLTGTGVDLARQIADGDLQGSQWRHFVPEGWRWA